MGKSNHPNKHIQAAVAYAVLNGWIIKSTGTSAHAWARILCPFHDREGCQLSVWSTPKNAENHARAIRRAIDRCPHITQEADR